MSKTRPYVPAGVNQQGRIQLTSELIEEALSKRTRPLVSSVFDFLALCILACAMAVMEEPKRAGRVTPPPMPWRDLYLGGVVVLVSVVAVWTLLGSPQ